MIHAAGIEVELADDDRYARFTERVAAGGPVDTKLGPGGVSYYVTRGGRRRFACHFNARPRSAESGRGFADFKPKATGLDPDGVVKHLERLLADRTDCRRGTAWWSVHFAASDDELVATAFREAIVGPMLERGDA